MNRPAAAPHAGREAGAAKRCGIVEPCTQHPPGGESGVDLLHTLAAKQVVAAAALVEDRRVIEERLHEVELAAEQPAEGVHALQHSYEHAQTSPHLAGTQAGVERAHLLADVAGRRAEERVLAVVIAVDIVPRCRHVGELHERQLGHRERRHADVDDERRIAIGGRAAHFHARPRATVGGADPHGRVRLAEPQRGALEPEGVKQLLGDEPKIELLAQGCRQRVDLGDAAQAREARADVSHEMSRASGRARARPGC